MRRRACDLLPRKMREAIAWRAQVPRPPKEGGWDDNVKLHHGHQAAGWEALQRSAMMLAFICYEAFTENSA